MILDNSGIDYLRMVLFLFGFLVNWKIEPNSCELNSLTSLQSGQVKVVKKT